MKKYELTSSVIIIEDGKVLYRIKALVDIPYHGVKIGDLGGFVEKEENLSHDGDAWISNNAFVFENACIYDNACVSGDAHIFGNARIFGNAWVGDNACIFGSTWIHGNSCISGNAWISGYVSVSAGSISGKTRIS